MTWKTSIGERVLIGAEAFLFASTLAAIVQAASVAHTTTPSDGSGKHANKPKKLSGGGNLLAPGVAFEKMNYGQQCTVLEEVARGLLTSTDTCPRLNHLNEAAIYFVFKFLIKAFHNDVDTAKDQYGEMIIAAYKQCSAGVDDVESSLTSAGLAMDSTDPEQWKDGLEALADRILWDRDFEMSDLLSNASAVVLTRTLIEDDYFKPEKVRSQLRADQRVLDVCGQAATQAKAATAATATTTLSATTAASGSGNVAGAAGNRRERQHHAANSALAKRQQKRQQDSIGADSILTAAAHFTQALAAVARERSTTTSSSSSSSSSFSSSSSSSDGASVATAMLIADVGSTASALATAVMRCDPASVSVTGVLASTTAALAEAISNCAAAQHAVFALEEGTASTSVPALPGTRKPAKRPRLSRGVQEGGEGEREKADSDSEHSSRNGAGGDGAMKAEGDWRLSLSGLKTFDTSRYPWLEARGCSQDLPDSRKAAVTAAARAGTAASATSASSSKGGGGDSSHGSAAAAMASPSAASLTGTGEKSKRRKQYRLMRCTICAKYSHRKHEPWATFQLRKRDHCRVHEASSVHLRAMECHKNALALHQDLQNQL